MIIAVEGSNSWGSFISFQVGRGRSIQNFVVFPAGKEGCEWFRASEWIKACFTLLRQANSGVLGSAPAVTKNQHRSFVDVARSFPANPCHSYSLPGLEKKLTELESNFNELSLKLDKVLHGMCHLRNLVAPLGEEESDTYSSVTSTNVSLGNNGGHESIVIDKMVIDLHFASGDNSKCWGSMLSVEELRGSPSLNLRNENHVGLISALASSCQGNDSHRIGVDESVDDLGCERDSEMTPEMIIPSLRLQSSKAAIAIAAEAEQQRESLPEEQSVNIGDCGRIQGALGHDCRVGSEISEETVDRSSQYAASCTSWEEIYSFEKGQRRKRRHFIVDTVVRQITFDATLDSEKFVVCSIDGLNQSCSGESSIQPVGVFNFDEMLREEQASCASISLPEGTSRGNKILIDGEYIDGFTIFKMLTPPPRAEVSKLAFRYWANLVARPLLVKLKESGLEIDVNIFGEGNWEI